MGKDKSKVVEELTSFLGASGAGGTALQVLLNSVIVIFALVIGIYSVFMLMKNAAAVSAAKTPEAKSEALKSLVFPIIGIIVAVAAPSIGLWALNFFGSKTEIIKSP